MKRVAIAHPPSKDSKTSQSTMEHLLGVAQISSSHFDNPIDKEYAYAIGKSHDLKGPYWTAHHLCPSCWSRNQDPTLCAKCELKKPTKFENKDIYHAPYAAIFMLLSAKNKFGNPYFDFDRPGIKEETMFAFIAGHHGGLGDINNTGNDRPSIKEKFSRLCDEMNDPKSDVSIALKDAEKMNINIVLPDDFMTDLYNKDYFNAFIKIKLFFSSLCDADSLDTEAHAMPVHASFRNPPKVSWEEMLVQYNTYYETAFPKKKNMRKKAKQLNKMREEIKASADAVARTYGRNIFSLEVPTGMGKLNASISFAFNHAVTLTHSHKSPVSRIIYVLPFLTITSQTAELFKKIFGPDAYIEHHTNAIYNPKEDELDQIYTKKVSIENWDYPIIITTGVQFLESIMSCYRGPSRKIHNICNSIVIFDEIQTIQNSIWAPTIKLFSALTEVMNCSVLFTTATMPTFYWENHRNQQFFENYKIKEIKAIPLVKNKKKLYKKCVRVHYHEINGMKPINMFDICEHIVQEKHATLVVFNTRRTAFEAYNICANANFEKVFLLTTLQCSKHRMALINEIKTRLENNEKILVISTQLIEAGVDLDFHTLYRKLAPLDSLVQSPGRCNRNWNIPYGEVYYFELEEEAGTPVDPFTDLYKERSKIALNVLKNTGIKLWLHKKLPAIFSQYNFKRLNDENVYKEYQTKCLENAWSDRGGVLKNLLTRNRNYRQASDGYKVIDVLTLGVFVPYGLTEVQYDEYYNLPIITKEIEREIQPYMIPIYEGDLKKMERICINKSPNGLRMLKKEFFNDYSENTGLSELLFRI